MPDFEHDPFVGVPDAGDLVDPEAEDATGEEVADPAHPDWVEPFRPEGLVRPGGGLGGPGLVQGF